MWSRVFRLSLYLSAAGLLVLPSAYAGEQGLSHVRVVRLSYVHGTVALKRPGATEWVKAVVNTPIQEGFALSTSEGSYAEVEFENGSTARLGQLSEIDFRQLALAPDGGKLNHLTFTRGYATFHFMPEKGDDYSVRVANATLTPQGKSEFRTDFAQDQLRVEVFNGVVEVADPTQSVRLTKDKVFELNTQTLAAFNIHSGIEKDAWDKWAEARDSQATLAFKDSAYSLHRPFYGWSDLDAYGEWAFYPGYGYGWSPFAAMGWSPYSMGMWSWYSGFGWTWISAEPWGWLPFHYGMWNFAPGYGWFWMPGTFGTWSPAMVSWYSGPGWIGWAPAGFGVGGRCNCVTAVPTSVVQNGGMVTTSDNIHIRPHEARPINGPSFQPSEFARLGGTPLRRPVGESLRESGTARPAMGGMGPASGSRVRTSAAVRARSTPAPPTVLMGGSATAAEREALTAHHGFWGRLAGSGPQPLRVRQGQTLGGRLPYTVVRGETRIESAPGVGVQGGPMVNRAAGHRASPDFSRPAPRVMSRRGAGGGGFPRGAGASSQGGFGAARSAGSVFSGGGTSSGARPSGAASAPAPRTSGGPQRH